MREIVACCHFRDHESGAKLCGQPPERCIGDARHRREKNPVGERNIAYFQWLRAERFRAGHGCLMVLTCASLRTWISIEHKSCAVKRHAYTLATSDDLASAVQQNKRFP